MNVPSTVMRSMCCSVKYTHPMQMVHLSVVACGDRQEETLIMIKSAVILSSAHVFVHIFADDELQPIFKEQVNLPVIIASWWHQSSWLMFHASRLEDLFHQTENSLMPEAHSSY